MKLTFKEYSYIDGLTGEKTLTVKPSRYVKLLNNLTDEEIIEAYHEAVIKENEQFEKDCKITEYYLIIRDEMMELFGIDKESEFADIDLDFRIERFGGSEFIEHLAKKWYVNNEKPLILKELTRL